MEQESTAAVGVAEASGGSRAKSRQTAASNRGSVGLVLLSVLFAAAGQLIFKAALNQIGKLTLSIELIGRLLTEPLMLVGLIVFAASAMLWLVALMRAELSFAYPFLSLSYVLVLIGGAVVFQETITPLRVAGFGAIIIGLFVVASSARQDASNGTA